MSTQTENGVELEQFSTFTIGGRLYGIDVSKVQEVVRPLPIAQIPGSPSHIRGLINLRGQVATAVGLRELYAIDRPWQQEFMNVVCRIDSALLALQVEEIGDVVEIKSSEKAPIPSTVPNHVKRFLHAVVKFDGELLSIVNIEEVTKYLKEQGEHHDVAA